MLLPFDPLFWVFPYWGFFPPRTQDNIQKVMKEIDHVVSYHNIVKMRQGKKSPESDSHESHYFLSWA